MRRVCFIIIALVCTSMACAQKGEYSANVGFLGSVAHGDGYFVGASVMFPKQWGFGVNMLGFSKRKETFKKEEKVKVGEKMVTVEKKEVAMVERGGFQLGLLWRKKLNKFLTLDGSFLIGYMITETENEKTDPKPMFTHTNGLSIKISRVKFNIGIETGFCSEHGLEGLEEKPIYVTGKIGITFDLFDNT